MPYSGVGRSRMPGLDSVVPANMADGMRTSLEAVEAAHCGEGKAHRTIDEWVSSEIGLDVDELRRTGKLRQEQIDGIALAIHQMEQGQGFIIGDQTGVGKGRQAAALLLYAMRKGKKPVFFTQNANLFSDMYRDLRALLSDENGQVDMDMFPKPFIVNANGGDNPGRVTELDDDGRERTVFKALPSKKQAEVWKTDGEVPEGYDFVMVTYSQVNKVTEKNMPPKARWLAALCRDNYIVMDESHTAGGDSNTGRYFQGSIVPDSRGVTYLSATYAKRPENMLLYADKTVINRSSISGDRILDIVKRGGRTLQEVLSEALTSHGQMCRRERDMSDVITEWKTDTDEARSRDARRRYDDAAKAFNAKEETNKNGSNDCHNSGKNHFVQSCSC